jgi:hypothetical protein
MIVLPFVGGFFLFQGQAMNILVFQCCHPNDLGAKEASLCFCSIYPHYSYDSKEYNELEEV